jgi:organic radical activating enzyme
MAVIKFVVLHVTCTGGEPTSLHVGTLPGVDSTKLASA